MIRDAETYEQSRSYYEQHPSERVRALWIVYCAVSNVADEQREVSLEEWVDRAESELYEADSAWFAERMREVAA
jgi:hypothetical protein